MKIIIFLLVIILGYLLYKTRLGYVLALGYLVSLVINPVHKIIIGLFHQYIFLEKAYDLYLPCILLVFFLFQIASWKFGKKRKQKASQIHEEMIPSVEKQKTEQRSTDIGINEEKVLNDETNFEEYLIDNNLLSLFSLKKSFWDSPAEYIVYDVLKEFLDKNYVIAPHVGLREIMNWDWKYDWKLTHKINAMHFDFVIYHKSHMMNRPALIIEVFGSDHFDIQKPRVRQNDELKQAILRKLDISLISIDLSKSLSDEDVKKKVCETIKNNVPSRDHYAVYCPKCSSVMEIRANVGGELFYGCKKFPKCKGNRDIFKVAPLYSGIKIKDFDADSTRPSEENEQ